MAGPEHTPAPGRRFLPASSSSSTTKSVDWPSARRNPFSGSRSTQLPSSSYLSATPRFQQSTQLPSSSSYSATPRFQQSTQKVADDIQTSFDDEADSPLLNGRLTITSGAPIDVLDDDEHCPSPLYNRTGDVGVDSRWHAESESSPLQHRQGAFPHATKRRKLIPPGVGNAELITVSSPSEDDRSDDVDHPSDAESPAWQSDLEDDFPLAVRRTPKESGRFAHFKSLASAVVRPGPSSKPAFRTNPEDISHGQTVSAPVLPDIFSPSRRKGKRDYIPGGMADLVRSWVLAIPAQESHGDGQSLPEQVLSIAHVMPDSSGRFCIATDENGARWLLPHQQEKAGIGSLSTLRPGARIVVKGQATKWGLNLDSRESSTVTVAAYWEIVSPG